MQWTDVWLLLSILLGGGQTNEGASLDSVIRTGDGINHSIFRTDELASGMYRLTENGYVFVKDGRFFATDKSKEWFKEAQEGGASIYNTWDRLGVLMGAQRFPGPYPNPANTQQFPGIDEQAVSEATERWHKQAQQWLKK